MVGSVTGTRNGEPWPGIGEEIVLPDEEGASLCGIGMAVPVAEPEKPEMRGPAAKKAAAKAGA